MKNGEALVHNNNNQTLVPMSTEKTLIKSKYKKRGNNLKEILLAVHCTITKEFFRQDMLEGIHFLRKQDLVD